MSYLDFLEQKMRAAPEDGITVNNSSMHDFLHEWQKEIVVWALDVGRAAIWADTGLGKTVMMLEWARHIGDTVLVVAPLAVCRQTVREGAKLDLTPEYVRHGGDITGPGIYVTNYEMVEQFDPTQIDAMVLDESSILKNSSGKMRDLLIDHFQPVPYRLACSATPAPNDPEELTNQAEFLGHMTRTMMLAAYFVHDSDAGWRMKGHAQKPMLQWMATWALAVRRPSDLGHEDDGYILPGLEIEGHTLDVDVEAEGQLFATDIGGVGGRARVRKQTLDARCERAAELVAAEPGEPWLLWAGLNDEAARLTKLIPDAVNVHGGLTPEEKADKLLAFADGDIRVLVTKPSIASQGLNYQHCARMAFIGLSDSYEAYYQAIRRCYRYGQQRVVKAHVIVSALESQIATNVRRKERQAETFTASLVNEMRRVRNDGRTAV